MATSQNSTPSPRELNPLALLRLLRPRQWVKNGFVLAPLLFVGGFTDPAQIAQALLAFALFCLAASAAYILNDWHDLPQDKKHPQKSRQRPLAAGQVSLPQSLALLCLLYGLMIWGGFHQPQVALVLLAYLLMNLAYTFILKHQPVIDIFVIAIGFVLRVYAGALALSVPLSPWMFVTTLCLALYLAAVKRRQELVRSGGKGRRVLAHYSVALVDRYAEMAAVGALVFYGFFVIEHSPQLVITIPLVLYGLFRYWFVVEAKDGGESPTDALLSDWQLMLTLLLWIAISAATLQGAQ